ncbi:MAG: hypothetical protein IJF71_03710, partial [Clostridia bacterium]|nr:hypothetical protein [Clostridia bacterium]
MSIQWSKEVKLLLLIATSVLLLASLGLLIAESVGKKRKTNLLVSRLPDAAAAAQETPAIAEAPA